MRRFWILMVLAGILFTACQPAVDNPQDLPTLAVLPSVTPANAATAQVAADTETPPPTATLMPATAAPTQTTEATPLSETPSPIPTKLPVTIEIREEVRLATLTPVPPGGNEPVRTTPVIMADVVITESDFQRAVDLAVEDSASIQAANINFVPDGINVELTAPGGTAYITGRVLLLIQVSGSFATITIGDVAVNAAEPPEAYLEVVNGEFFSLMIEVFDTLLTERVGEGHDLENIVLNDKAMEVFLLVPQG